MCVFLYFYLLKTNRQRERERERDMFIQRLNEESVDCDLWRQNKHEAFADEELLLASEEQHANKLLASS